MLETSTEPTMKIPHVLKDVNDANIEFVQVNKKVNCTKDKAEKKKLKIIDTYYMLT